MRRRNLLASGAALATVGATGLARPAIAQGASAKVLRFVPQADLANPDPIWTTATVATNHGYMVWDTLYGINDALIGQPQMCAGHEVSADELTWTFTLRDGLKFTDGEPVRGIDCTTSIARWFGETASSTALSGVGTFARMSLAAAAVSSPSSPRYTAKRALAAREPYFRASSRTTRSSTGNG